MAVSIVDGSRYLDEVKQLILEYTRFLNRDLHFQHIEQELEDLQSKYAAPNGQILVALTEEGTVIGCVAFRRLTEKRCEMKRLYVKEAFRKLKAGRGLAEAILASAKAQGYQEMVLDTIKPLQGAVHLYEKLGFEQIPAYYDNPMDDVIYMRRAL